MAKDKAKVEIPEEGGIAGDAADHIDEFTKLLERLESLALNAEFTSGTLVGDIRDVLIDTFKNRPKPWSQLSEGEQRDLAKALENVAKTVIKKTVLVVAEQDEISVTATVKGYSAKGGVFKINAEARGDEDTAQQLFGMDGHDVVIMSADSQRFTGQRKDPEVQPDQAALFSDAPQAEEPPALDPDGDEEDTITPSENAEAVAADVETVTD